MYKREEKQDLVVQAAIVISGHMCTVESARNAGADYIAEESWKIAKALINKMPYSVQFK